MSDDRFMTHMIMIAILCSAIISTVSETGLLKQKIECYGKIKIIRKIEIENHKFFKRNSEELKPFFKDETIHPLGLLVSAIIPTTVAWICIWYLPTLRF